MEDFVPASTQEGPIRQRKFVGPIRQRKFVELRLRRAEGTQLLDQRSFRPMLILTLIVLIVLIVHKCIYDLLGL